MATKYIDLQASNTHSNTTPLYIIYTQTPLSRQSANLYKIIGECIFCVLILISPIKYQSIWKCCLIFNFPADCTVHNPQQQIYPLKLISTLPLQ